MSQNWDLNKYFFGSGSSAGKNKNDGSENKFKQANDNASRNVERFLDVLAVKWKKAGSTYLILDHMRGDKNFGSAHLCPRIQKYSDFSTGMIGVDLVDMACYFRPDLTTPQVLDIMVGL